MNKPIAITYGNINIYDVYDYSQLGQLLLQPSWRWNLQLLLSQLKHLCELSIYLFNWPCHCFTLCREAVWCCQHEAVPRHHSELHRRGRRQHGTICVSVAGLQNRHRQTAIGRLVGVRRSWPTNGRTGSSVKLLYVSV